MQYINFSVKRFLPIVFWLTKENILLLQQKIFIKRTHSY